MRKLLLASMLAGTAAPAQSYVIDLTAYVDMTFILDWEPEPAVETPLGIYGPLKWWGDTNNGYLNFGGGPNWDAPCELCVYFDVTGNRVRIVEIDGYRGVGELTLFYDRDIADDLHNIGSSTLLSGYYYAGGDGRSGPPYYIYEGPVVAAWVPEPATWAMMIGGFVLVGTSLRHKKIAVSFA